MYEFNIYDTISNYNINKDFLYYPQISYVQENSTIYYSDKPRILYYTTTGASQEIQLINTQEYLEYIRVIEKGEELSATGTGALNYTFENPGQHLIELKFKDDSTTMDYVFSGCTELTSISDNLFKNCTGVTSFASAFQQCSSLVAVPNKLFDRNINVTSFKNTFYYCLSLKEIPEFLFSQCRKVENFTNTFRQCIALTSNTPIDSDGTPIYNRSGEGKEGYSVATDYFSCFSMCSKMQDYSTIPSEWKV